MNRLIVVSYDIIDDNKRARVAKILKDFGSRVQYSVFECRISYKQLIELKDLLTKAVDLRQDSIRIYALCQDCSRNIFLIGESSIHEEEPPDFLVV